MNSDWGSNRSKPERESQCYYAVRYGVADKIESKMVLSTLGAIRRHMADFYKQKILNGVDPKFIVFEYDFAQTEIWTFISPAEGKIMESQIALGELVVYYDNNWGEYDAVHECHTTETILRELKLYSSVYSPELVEALQTAVLLHCK